jgi:hypothetical protein
MLDEVRIMKKLFILCGLVVALIGFTAFNAGATLITGDISLSGTSSTDNANLALATAFTSFSNVVVSTTGGSGSYTPALSGQSATMTTFTFSPSFSPDPLVPLWTFTYSGSTYSFNATSLVVSSSIPDSITMGGTGMAYITGFNATPGTWVLSANDASGTESFSLSTQISSVPVPAAMLLFAPGLAGLAAIRRRLKK